MIEYFYMNYQEKTNVCKKDETNEKNDIFLEKFDSYFNIV